MKQRITISLDEDQAAKFDQLIAERGYENRSEAFRDLIRAAEASQTLSDPPSGATCVAVVSYVYNHHERQLSMRLTQEHQEQHRHPEHHQQHEHGDLVISQMHAHIGHEDCMEAVFLKGTVAEVRAFADKLIAEPGIRHGSINIIPAHVHRH